jgi:serine/threonine protein kinase
MSGNWPQVPINRTIANRYRLINSIGEGGLGEVFVAEDTKFVPPRRVAVKVLHSKFLHDPEMVAQLRQEAGVMAQFAHPHILRILDFDVTLDHAYIVSEYAPNGSLKDKIKAGTTEEPQVAARYLEKIAEALDEAHKIGLIHRDIKPQNILFGAEDRPMLADFSLAMTINQPKPNALVKAEAWGTGEYAAPEVWDEKAGKASDIYALGAVLFEMLAGKPPYTASSMEELERKHKTFNIPQIPAGKPAAKFPELQKVLKEALAKQFNERPSSASTFYKNYVQAMEQSPLAATKTATAQTKKFPNISRQVISFIVITIIGVSVLILSSLNNNPRTNSTPAVAARTVTPRPTATPFPTATPRPTVTPTRTPLPTATPFPTVQAVNLSAGKVIEAHSGAVNQIAWGNKSTILATAGSDGMVKLWDTEGNLIRTVKVGSPVNTIAWSYPNGDNFITGNDDGVVRQYDLNGKSVKEYRGHSGKINYVAWKPDGSAIVSAGEDKTARVWYGNTQDVFVYSSPIKIVGWWGNAYDTFFTITGDNTFRLGGSGFTAQIADFEVSSIDISFNSPEAATCLKGIFQRTLPFGATVRGDGWLAGQPCLVTAWSPLADKVALAGSNNEIRIMEQNRGISFILNGHADTITSVAWSGDGKTLASASKDGTVRLWKLP